MIEVKVPENQDVVVSLAGVKFLTKGNQWKKTIFSSL
jgi:hypothetical protein